MKNILVTGGTGFIGRNILPSLRERYNVSAPTRAELDLLNQDAVNKYIQGKRFDAVLHLANPTGHNSIDIKSEIFERSLQVFMNLVNSSKYYGKMIYIGSGAEYGKHRPIVQIREENFGDILPKDSYGLSRYIMNELAYKYPNIINLRLFGCHGFGDMPHKLLPYVINHVRAKKTVILRQDCLFDFLYVMDIVPVLIHFIENKAKYPSYNLCSGQQLLISNIAKDVCCQMGIAADVVFQQEGLNNEYTASNARLKSEIPKWNPTNMTASIKAILKLEGLK